MKYIIKFSHNYPKLWNQTTAELIAVHELWNSSFNPDLLEYDTVYKDADGETQHYPLYHAHFLQLIFIGNKHIPFCTIRSYTDKKKRYYTDAISKQFDIVLVKE